MARKPIDEAVHAATRARLAQATLEAVITSGYEALTLHDLAASGGVSRSTFLRYMGSKDEALATALASLGERVGDAVRKRPLSEPLWEALRRGMDVVATSHERAGLTLFDVNVRLQQDSALGRVARHMSLWRDSLATAVQKREPEWSALACATTAMAALGCLSVATDAFAVGDDFDALLDEAFAVIEVH